VGSKLDTQVWPIWFPASQDREIDQAYLRNTPSTLPWMLTFEAGA
jgi:hypothetical protein